MRDDASQPVVYVKHDCPFSFKVRVFLLEAGLLDRVILREASTPDEERVMRAELTPHIARVSYPAARFAADDYLVESDEIVARFADLHDVRTDRLPTFRAYVDGPFPQLMRLYRENAELKK